MTDAALSIKRFERQVMWRKRWLALQDRAALMILVSCAVAAGLVLLARLKEGGKFNSTIFLAVVAMALAALSFNWLRSRASEREAAFAIDNTLGLEDRLITAHEIIEQGGPKKLVESALIEDAASRVADQRASSVVPYRQKRWHALSLLGVIALVAAVMIPEKALPGGEAIAEARADIQAAGEQLEQAATEAEQIAPAESETANLAKEQAALGRSFRRSSESRAEALKKLSSLEARIRERHDVLAETRADEIVNIAERRMRSALSNKPKPRAQATPNEDENAREVAAELGDQSKSQSAEPRAKSERSGASKEEAKSRNSNASESSVAQKPVANKSPDKSDNKSGDKSGDKSELAADVKPDSQGQAARPTPQNRLPEPVSSQGNKNSASQQKGQNQNPSEANTAEENAGGAKEGEPKKGEQKEQGEGEQKPEEQKPEGSSPATNPLGGLVADQAAKALPQMSQELLNKAAQLRAGQLSAEDIKRLAQAAQFLAQDLKQIAQSKEFQQALEQMARQITPEQIEQVARQLMNQEELKRELEAAARLMMQNQQAKEMVAGIKQSVEDIAKQFGGRDGGEQKGRSRGAGGDGPQGGKGGAGNNSRLQLGRAPDSDKLKGRGKESTASGNLQRGTGGEYLFLQTRAGAGAARAPYSTAYPQYRREAERSVQRSQVPAHMRSMVRNYFDAINPDASKKP